MEHAKLQLLIETYQVSHTTRNRYHSHHSPSTALPVQWSWNHRGSLLGAHHCSILTIPGYLPSPRPFVSPACRPSAGKQHHGDGVPGQHLDHVHDHHSDDRVDLTQYVGTRLGHGRLGSLVDKHGHGIAFRGRHTICLYPARTSRHGLCASGCSAASHRGPDNSSGRRSGMQIWSGQPGVAGASHHRFLPIRWYWPSTRCRIRNHLLPKDLRRILPHQAKGMS